MKKKKKNYFGTVEDKKNYGNFEKKIIHTEPEALEEKSTDIKKLKDKIPKKTKNRLDKHIIIALTGGATGGHIFPLLSTYNYLREDDNYDFLWVGEEEGLEYEIAKKNGIKFLDIGAGKVRRYFDWRNFYEPLKNLTGFFQGIYYIFKYKIDIVFSKGGYVSLPLCLAAFFLRKKIYIHESDTIGGIANKIIGKLATKVFYTFPNEKTEKGGKHILTGQIMNPELIDGLENLIIEPNPRLEILIIAGSQGSSRIFEGILKILPDFPLQTFTVILGEKNVGYRTDFEKFKNVNIYDFISQKKLGDIYKRTDVAITRGGATTLFELASFGIHSIIVPLTESAGNHQEKNAHYFRKKYGSDVLNENKNFEVDLYRKLKKYTNMRKNGLYLDNFFEALQIINTEIEKS